MKLFVCIVFLLSVFAVTSFAAIAGSNFNDPKNPGKCTIKENIILSPGESVKDPDQDCALIICGENGLPKYQTCGVQKVHGCTEYVDKSLPYPDCCKREIIC